MVEVESEVEVGLDEGTASRVTAVVDSGLVAEGVSPVVGVASGEVTSSTWSGTSVVVRSAASFGVRISSVEVGSFEVSSSVVDSNGEIFSFSFSLDCDCCCSSFLRCFRGKMEVRQTDEKRGHCEDLLFSKAARIHYQKRKKEK
jgi:hypothetical protein